MAVITSVKSGNWSDSSVWNSGTVPATTDDVVIAAGHTVVFDVEHNNTNSYIRTVDIYGTLKADRTKNTTLVVSVPNNAIRIRGGGTLDWGKSNDRIPADYVAKINSIFSSDAVVFFYLDNGANIYMYGSSDYYGGEYLTYLYQNWTTGNTIRVKGDFSTKWKVGQHLLLYAYCVGDPTAAGFIIAAISAINGYNSQYDYTEFVVNKNNPSFTYYANGPVYNISRNVIVGVYNPQSDIFTYNSNRGTFSINSPNYVEFDNVSFWGIHSVVSYVAFTTHVFNRCVFRNSNQAFVSYLTAKYVEFIECIITSQGSTYCLGDERQANHNRFYFNNCHFIGNVNRMLSVANSVLYNCRIAMRHNFTFWSSNNIYKNCLFYCCSSLMDIYNYKSIYIDCTILNIYDWSNGNNAYFYNCKIGINEDRNDWHVKWGSSYAYCEIYNLFYLNDCEFGDNCLGSGNFLNTGRFNIRHIIRSFNKQKGNNRTHINNCVNLTETSIKRRNSPFSVKSYLIWNEGTEGKRPPVSKPQILVKAFERNIEPGTHTRIIYVLFEGWNNGNGVTDGNFFIYALYVNSSGAQEGFSTVSSDTNNQWQNAGNRYPKKLTLTFTTDVITDVEYYICCDKFYSVSYSYVDPVMFRSCSTGRYLKPIKFDFIDEFGWSFNVPYINTED